MAVKERSLGVEIGAVTPSIPPVTRLACGGACDSCACLCDGFYDCHCDCDGACACASACACDNTGLEGACTGNISAILEETFLC